MDKNFDIEFQKHAVSLVSLMENNKADNKSAIVTSEEDHYFYIISVKKYLKKDFEKIYG